MSTKRVYNFSAGPATLPLEVIEYVRDNFMEFGGRSILEISHRSNDFSKIMDEAKDLIYELTNIPRDYHLLFLQGGAAQQFALVPLNFLKNTADYLITGNWSKRAAQEAACIGNVNTAFSSENINFSKVPFQEEINLNPKADYVHITSNNTIYGTEYFNFPNTEDVPLIADMSSEILSREIDYTKFDLIYAGAQKNLGPAGLTLVIVNNRLLAKTKNNIPSILKYSNHADKKSLYNTPPVFSIYVTLNVLRWLKSSGGVKEIEKTNIEKASIIYDFIDNSNLYINNVDVLARSRMNIPFNLANEELTGKFISEAENSGFVGLKGHRLVGGLRASIYNAFPLKGVIEFVEFMKEFERKA